MELPSKELFEEVTEITVENIHYGVYKGNVEYSEHGRINIYELMHMMKEWAYGQGYSLISYRNTLQVCICDIRKNGLGVFDHRAEDTEFEAVTKACEWILKEPK